jgi:hypothetical protein
MTYYPAALREVTAAGYVIFDGGLFDLNLILRRGGAGDDDEVLVCYRSGSGGWTTESFPCSTLPSTRYLVEPMNKRGTAILAPGQYRGAYSRGLHRGRPSIVQTGKVTVYRDNDLDDVAETEGRPRDSGYFGLNIHTDRGGSAGCILAAPLTIARLRALFAKQEEEGHGSTVSVVLLCC